MKNLSLDIRGNYSGGGVCEECAVKINISFKGYSHYLLINFSLQHNTEGINCEKCKAGFYLPFGVDISNEDACRRKTKTLINNNLSVEFIIKNVIVI